MVFREACLIRAGGPNQPCFGRSLLVSPAPKMLLIPELARVSRHDTPLVVFRFGADCTANEGMARRIGIIAGFPNPAKHRTQQCVKR